MAPTEHTANTIASTTSTTATKATTSTTTATATANTTASDRGARTGTRARRAVTFAPTSQVAYTHGSTTYDRTPCWCPPQSLRQCFRIHQELNAFKATDMRVHPASVMLTSRHPEDMDELHAERPRRYRHVHERLRTGGLGATDEDARHGTGVFAGLPGLVGLESNLLPAVDCAEMIKVITSVSRVVVSSVGMAFLPQGLGFWSSCL